MDDYLRAKLIKEFDMNFEDALNGLKNEIKISGEIFLMSRMRWFNFSREKTLYKMRG
jgi:hypothetical protein